MNGYACIFQLDGGDADVHLLQTISAPLQLYGPETVKTWHDGCAAFATITNLHNPALSLQKGDYRLNGCVRLDARHDLCDSLAAQGLHTDTAMSDAELVLNAWNLWGQDTLSRIAGDFSFVIWNCRTHSLYCARDQMGVKPLFYIQLPSVFICSNSLHCLLRHPAISTELNDQAMVDNLVFGYNAVTTSTIYRDIRQVAPAHSLILENGKIREQHYWSLPMDPVFHYRNKHDYVMQFRTLLEQSVRDRTRDSDTGILCSGGLDSTSLAIVTHRTQRADNRTPALHLYTNDIHALWPEDREKYFTSQLATYLHATTHIQSISAADLFYIDDRHNRQIPQPLMEPFIGKTFAHLNNMRHYTPVILTGQGGDSIFTPSPYYLPRLLSQGHWRQFVTDYLNTALYHQRLPFLAIRSLLKKHYERQPWRPVYPAWLKPDMIGRVNLDERWRTWIQTVIEQSATDHPTRPELFADLQSPLWPHIFMQTDTHTFGKPVEFRHPYFDLRLLAYMLRVPPSPWCDDKALLRMAMKGDSPDDLRLRPKSTPFISPVVNAMKSQEKLTWQQLITTVENLSDYVDFAKFRTLAENPGLLKSGEIQLVSHPIELAQWRMRNVN